MSLTIFPGNQKLRPIKQNKGLIYLKVRVGKVDVVKLNLFKKQQRKDT